MDRPAGRAAAGPRAVAPLLALALALAPLACVAGDADAPTAGGGPGGRRAGPERPPPLPEPEADGAEDALGAWLAAQNRRTRAWLTEHAELPAVVERARRLGTEERYGLPERSGPLTFYAYNDGLQDRDVWLVTETIGISGRTLLDPNVPPLDATGGVAAVWPDRAGRRVAYAVAEPGTGARTVSVRDVGSGADLPGQLHGVAADAPVAWVRDGFYYARRVAAAEESARPSRVTVWYHRLASDQAADVAVLQPADPARDAFPFASADGRFLIARTVGPGGEGILAVDLWAPEPRWARVLEPGAAHHDLLAVRDDVLYLRTTASAPRGRILAVDLLAPEEPIEIVPERAGVLVSAAVVGERLVLAHSRDARTTMEILDVRGQHQRDVVPPAPGAVSGLRPGGDEQEAYYWLAPPGWPGAPYGLDLGSGMSRPLWGQRPAVASVAPVTERTRFPSDDGVWVTATLVSRSEIRRTGELPVLLVPRTGAAGEPGTHATWTGWLELGGVLAQVDARHPGSPADRLRGRDATEAALADLVSAAEWLIASGFTDTPRLAIAGSGDWGPVLAAALTRRPDLFAAVVLPPYPPTTVETLQSGRCYPATLAIAHGDHGPAARRAYRMVSSLQQLQGCEAPILLRRLDAAARGVDERIAEIAEPLAFLQAILRAGETGS